jgi:hypothetical protein
MNLFRKAEPETIAVKGHQLRCPVCGNTYFWTRRTQLNTSVASFLALTGQIDLPLVLYAQIALIFPGFWVNNKP